MLISCAATTPAPPVRPQISDAIRAPCEPLPPLAVADGDDMRPALLRNRIDSERVHAECSARHRAALRAVGVEPLATAPAADHRSRFERLLQEFSARLNPTPKGPLP